MITRLLLSTGEAIYPNFLSKEDREKLSLKLKHQNLKMQCACRNDIELLYGISADFRIIPLHKHYEHAQWCSRCSGDKRNSACIYDEDGKTTVFLKFNPLNFTVPSIKRGTEEVEEVEEEEEFQEVLPEEESESTKKEEEKKGPKKERLPDYNLRNLVKGINHDTYAMRLMSGKYAYLSEEYFVNALMARLKSTYIHGMDKSLKDLSINADGLSFFYSKVCALEETRIIFPAKEGTYSRYVFKSVIEKASLEFTKLYGITPENYINKRSLMAAGFAYKKFNKYGAEYKCIGRLCFFAVTKNGLYCDTLTERDTVELLMEQGKQCEGQFLYPDTDNSPADGIVRFSKLNKEGYLYLYRKPRKPQTPYLYCDCEVPEETTIREFMEEIKRQDNS